MRALPAARDVKFVYDCPDFEEFEIFGTDREGAAMLSLDNQRLADDHEVM